MNGYKKLPLSFGRKMVAVSASITREKNTIHSLTEVDITKAREMMKLHFEQTGNKLSLTAYIVGCLAKTISLYPDFNSFIKRKNLIVLDDLTISVLIERDVSGEKVPEPFGIQQVQMKSISEIQQEIRKAQEIKSDQIGSLSNYTWVKFIPVFLLKQFIRFAESNIKLAKAYGKVCVTSVGMFSKEKVWFIPHGSATVLLTVGSIDNKVVKIDNEFVEREHLCLTVSFNHDIVDGAPAARFMNDLISIIKSGELIR